MSINPPLDIVLDVARAADPARYRAAVKRLDAISAPGAPSFEDALDPGLAGALESAGKGVGQPATAAADLLPKAKIVAGNKAYRDFEAMTLATFIEASLPQNASEIFGEGTAGGVWKTMLAQQIAGEMAERGGIGIAAQLSSFEKLAAGEKPGAVPGPVSAGQSPFDPALLSMTAERGFIAELAGKTDDTSKT